MAWYSGMHFWRSLGEGEEEGAMTYTTEEFVRTPRMIAAIYASNFTEGRRWLMSDADGSGGAAMTAPKLLDTEAQIQALRRQVAEWCVSIASSIDTTPPEMVPPEMRERWLQELRQATVAITLVIDRLAGGVKAEA